MFLSVREIEYIFRVTKAVVCVGSEVVYFDGEKALSLHVSF